MGLGGYFKVLVVLTSRVFLKCFALNHAEMSFSGGDNAEGNSMDDATAFVGNEGVSRHSQDEHPWNDNPQDESIEYLGTIREEIKRILPHYPDLTLLRWLGRKFETPF